MDPRRKRQVETTRSRHPDLYVENGKKPHARGFSDPEVARRAALKGHENRRKKKEEERANDTNRQEG